LLGKKPMVSALPLNINLWLGEKSPSLSQRKNKMTVEFGIGMFVYNMIALLIGAIIVYKVINRNNKE